MNDEWGPALAAGRRTLASGTLHCLCHSPNMRSYDDKSCPLPHCLLVWLRTPTPMAMTVMRHLEVAGVALLNTGTTLTLAGSRVRAAHELWTSGLPTVKALSLTPPCSLDWVTGALQFPVSF